MMIHVKFQGSPTQVSSYRLYGHAGYAETGSDIVCAGVSALVLTITNELEGGIDFSDTPNDFRVASIPATTNNCVLTHTLFVGISSIAEEYPQHLRVDWV